MDLGVTFVIALVMAGLCGLRAFLPPLVVGCMMMAQAGPGDEMTGMQAAGILVLLTLGFVEWVADKIPVIDHIQDAVATVIRPIIGGLTAVMVMQYDGGVLSTLPAFAAGAAAALGVHALKATTRGVSTVTSGGTANPALSILEDVTALGLVVAAGMALAG